MYTVPLSKKGSGSIRCSKFINRLREKDKSGLQTKTEGNTSNIRELRHKRNTTLKCKHTETNLTIRVYETFTFQNVMKLETKSEFLVKSECFIYVE